MTKAKTAILLSAGLGNRMKPITNFIPKPLVKVNGKALIETVIDSLIFYGVENIYIVTGYLADKFSFLEKKYNGKCNINFVYNKDYETKNNISSLYVVKDLIKDDCFICESDLFISDEKLFSYLNINRSCYFGKFVEGHSDDWAFVCDSDKKITKISIGGDDLFNMVGISVWSKDDFIKIGNRVGEMMNEPNGDKKFWDEAVNDILDKISVHVLPVVNDQIIEIDTVDELERVRKNYEK